MSEETENPRASDPIRCPTPREGEKTVVHLSSYLSVESADSEADYSAVTNGGYTPYCTEVPGSCGDADKQNDFSNANDAKSDGADSVFADAERQSTGSSQSGEVSSPFETADATKGPASNWRTQSSSSESGVRRPSLVGAFTSAASGHKQTGNRPQQKMVRSKSTTASDHAHKDGHYRDSIASRIRLEHARTPLPDPGPPPMDYLTPLQKKDQMIKDLKADLKGAQNQLAAMEADREKRDKEMEATWKAIVDAKDREIEDLKWRLDQTESEKTAHMKKNVDLSQKVVQLEDMIQNLKKTMQRNDEETQAMYFKMYEKGKASAEFERQEEVEKLAAEAPQTVTDQEILRKLKRTEKQLERWQSLKRDEIYKNGAPVTDAEVKVRFMKDAMFHFLTDSKDRLQHLRAMVNIFDYTEVQNQVIADALKKKKIDVLNANFVK